MAKRTTSVIVTYTEAQNNLKSIMDKVWDDCTPVTITRTGGRHVVMMSKENMTA